MKTGSTNNCKSVQDLCYRSTVAEVFKTLGLSIPTDSSSPSPDDRSSPSPTEPTGNTEEDDLDRTQ